MNAQLKEYIDHYTELERSMQELITELSSSLCEQCTLCCCDAMICEEAIESPFLKLVHQQTDQFSDRYGFLSTTGCSLDKGRPPACYEYFCDDQFYHQPDELYAEILQILGALLSHATRNARGDSPLAEIMQKEALDNLDFKQMEEQLQESLQALEIIKAFYHDRVLTDESYQTLKRIQLSPKD